MAAKSIAKHISETSSSEEIFKTSIKIYSKAPIESNFTDDLKYSANEAQQLDNEEKKRKKKINLLQLILFKGNKIPMWVRCF